MKRLIALCMTAVLLAGCASTGKEFSSISATFYAEPDSQEVITLGTWFDMPALSDKTEDYANAKVRVTAITRGEPAEDMYKAYFSRYGTEYKNSLMNESLEYLVVSYEMSLPTDFPTDNGIPVLNATFKPVNEDGTPTFGSVRIATTGVDISETVDIVKPGETSSTQQYCCIMLKDVKAGEYMLQCTSGNTTKYIKTI